MAGVLQLLVKDEVGGGPQVMPMGRGLRVRDGAIGSSRWRYTGSTTDATPTALTFHAENEALANNTAYAFHGMVVGRTSGGNADVYWFAGGIKRGAAAANTAMVGTATKTVYEDDAGADVNVTADTTNGRMTVTVTGVAATNINWVAEFEYIPIS